MSLASSSPGPLPTAEQVTALERALSRKLEFITALGDEELSTLEALVRAGLRHDSRGLVETLAGALLRCVSDEQIDRGRD